MLTVKRVKLAYPHFTWAFQIQACVALELTYPANSSLFLKCHQDYYDTKTAYTDEGSA